MSAIINTMKNDLTFGIEIEVTQIGLAAAAAAVAGVLGCSAGYRFSLPMADGREWKVVSDASLGRGGAEVVSPILTYTDIEVVQEIVRALRANGAVASDDAGIHIHIGGAAFDGKNLRNLVKYVSAKEDMIHHALNLGSRLNWCQHSRTAFVEQITAMRSPSRDSVVAAYYGADAPRYNEARVSREEVARRVAAISRDHYNRARYRGINLHALGRHGTIEFRWFASTLHAGRVKAYIQFVMALAAKALVSRSASATKPNVDLDNMAGEGYAMRVVLLRLDLIGDEFKTCRKFMMDRFTGDSTRAPEARRQAAPAPAETAERTPAGGIDWNAALRRTRAAQIAARAAAAQAARA